jgi:hypothetical protein
VQPIVYSKRNKGQGEQATSSPQTISVRGRGGKLPSSKRAQASASNAPQGPQEEPFEQENVIGPLRMALPCRSGDYPRHATNYKGKRAQVQKERERIHGNMINSPRIEGFGIFYNKISMRP